MWEVQMDATETTTFSDQGSAQSNDPSVGTAGQLTRPSFTSAAVAIPIMVERIVRDFEPVEIILFGSQARGDAQWDSDVDLLVVLPSAPSKHEAAIAIRRALHDIRIPKDIIISTPDEIARYGDMVGRILRPALREGKVLYARQ